MEVGYYSKLIDSCLQQGEHERAQGIIIVVGMFGAPGTAVDSNNVQSTFKELGFAVLPIPNPTSENLANLMEAASQYKYPAIKRFQFFAFYFAGHGGADGNGDLFIQTAAEVEGGPPPILHIEKYVIEPLKDLNVPCRLFLFDCCQSPGAGQAYRSTGGETEKGKKVGKRPRQVVAYAVSKGQKAVGNRDEGGLWTRHLCSNIREDIPLVNVLAKTNGAVAGVSFQDPTFICNIDDKVKVVKPAKKDQSTSSAGATSMASKPPPSSPAAPTSSSFNRETVCQYLQDKSSKWEKIGRSFKVPLNTRENLRRDILLDSEGRLEHVIDSWFTTATESDLTWDGFISILEEKMGFNDVARKVKADLKSGTIV